jgi:hypothetical protein
MVKWTPALADAINGLTREPITSDLDHDIVSRAAEYLGLPSGYELLPHQVSYTHCLLQRLDTYNERASHLAFKKAWEEAQ